MYDFFIEAFSNFSRVIVFLHVVSASLLIGSMFIIRFVVHPIESKIDNEKIKYNNAIKIMNRYFLLLVPIMLILVVSALFMNIGLGFKNGNPTTYVMVHTKEALWTFILFNFAYMYVKFLKAKKAFFEDNYIEVEENFVLMLRYLIPMNLILATISVYFGVILRGF